MIKSVCVRNYALIEKTEIELEPGFTIITGETGAGKSILLGAIGLTLGQRADVSVIKDRSKKCVVEITYEVKGYDLQAWFEENDLDYDDLVVVRREVLPDGKSRAFINDSPVNNKLLKQFGDFLIDVHSQHQSLLLGKPEYQLDILDTFCGNEAVLEEYKTIYDKRQRLLKELEEVKRMAREAEQEEDYLKFYRELYPMGQDPLFHIHLNVDYPFNLTGILYFPKIDNKFEIQKNKIQLYCNQVYVSDSVEGIVPEFLTLLHGVIDSPDIPLNVSRSYLQSDRNVKKISSHITKKVADSLTDIFKNSREEYEKKWDDLKIFIQYGMLTDEKFAERAKDIVLLKNTDGKYFTLEEYENLIKANQTDKDKNVVYLYATDKEEQYTYIQAAKERGYDVLLMDGQLDTHFINHLEAKDSNHRFLRVDSDVIEKLIQKEEIRATAWTEEEQEEMRGVFEAQIPKKGNLYLVNFEALGEGAEPVVITRSEFIRRMKEMSAMNPGMGFYGQMGDQFTLVVNTEHRLVKSILKDEQQALGEKLKPIVEQVKEIEGKRDEIDALNKDKKEEEIPQVDKDRKKEYGEQLEKLRKEKQAVLEEYGKENKIVGQLIDLALLANGLLKGEALNRFVKRSVELIG